MKGSLHADRDAPSIAVTLGRPFDWAGGLAICLTPFESVGDSVSALKVRVLKLPIKCSWLPATAPDCASIRMRLMKFHTG